jgi:hypothetical protein
MNYCFLKCHKILKQEKKKILVAAKNTKIEIVLTISEIFAIMETKEYIDSGNSCLIINETEKKLLQRQKNNAEINSEIILHCRKAIVALSSSFSPFIRG